MKRQIALVTGDGSGPEMMAEATRIASKAALLDDLEIEWVDTPMGWNAYEKFGDTTPTESLKIAFNIGTIFFGGVGDPEFDKTVGKEKPEMMPEPRALLAIRKHLGLLLNFRPMRLMPELSHLSRLKSECIPEDGANMVFIRFLLEDSYFGTSDLRTFVDEKSIDAIGLKMKHGVTGSENLVSELSYYNRSTVMAYFRFAFRYARSLGLPLISVDKANVMARYVLWRKIAQKIHDAEFPDVELRHQLVDSANMLLFHPEKLHGVIACGNEHGDILSDGAAEMVGGMGLMHSSAINPKTEAAMFESGAGTAPTLAGLNQANPLGRILTGALMLRHISSSKGAAAIEDAVKAVLMGGYRTMDIAESDCDAKLVLGCKEMGQKVFDHIP
ncbi:MAG: isocitrate/isopropylmalate family dehydrogenase [Candidatus Pacebacteria bacterium]|nr:isocitrate/isopropylmalate family dehydrogenase [Candidatus Paceibacterota bacterium]